MTSEKQQSAAGSEFPFALRDVEEDRNALLSEFMSSTKLDGLSEEGLVNDAFVFDDADNSDVEMPAESAKSTPKRMEADENEEDDNDEDNKEEESGVHAGSNVVVSTREKIVRFRVARAKRAAKRRKKYPKSLIESDRWFEFINEGRTIKAGPQAELSATLIPSSQKTHSQGSSSSLSQKSDTISSAKDFTSGMRGTMDFLAFGLRRQIVLATRDLGWSVASPIQQAAIPHVLAGKDLLLNAVTGSGKTGAFVIPILQRLSLLPTSMSGRGTRVLIVTPTRELAAQCQRMIQDLAHYLRKMHVCLVVGGLSVSAQESALRRMPEMVVCTPGRMIDLLRNSHGIVLNDIEMFVLDEADRLLDMGFKDELNELIKHLPSKRQTLLLSATLTDDVLSLAELSLNSPLKITVSNSSSSSSSSSNLMTMASGLTQEFIRIRQGTEKYRKSTVLALCLGSKNKELESRVMVFCRTKRECHELSVYFGLFGLNSSEFHGNMSQTDRMLSLKAFNDGFIDYLICTDVAARGIDIPRVQTVINLEFPTNIKTYIHRVGRTARAGREGKSITLVGDSRRRLLKKLVENTADGPSASKMKSRSIHPEFLGWIKKQMYEMKGDIQTIQRIEETERELRLCDRQIQQGQNLVKFADQIARKPQKTWFVTKSEKKDIKHASHESDLGPQFTQSMLRDKLKSKIENSLPGALSKKLNQMKHVNHKFYDRESGKRILPRERRHLEEKRKRENEKMERKRELDLSRRVAAEAMTEHRNRMREERKANSTRYGMDLKSQGRKAGMKHNGAEDSDDNSDGGFRKSGRRKRNYSESNSTDRLGSLSKREISKIARAERRSQKRVARKVTASKKKKTRHVNRH